jgi:hypothetical protein
MLVVFIIIAALVAMFAGSVLSMLVLPTLASHAVRYVKCYVTLGSSHLNLCLAFYNSWLKR